MTDPSGEYSLRRSTVAADFTISPKPDMNPGVYLFSDEQGRILYVGMAHGLEPVLYRYKHLAGREKMRERAAARRLTHVHWLACRTEWSPPTLERLMIKRFSPPWNTQHNWSPRSEENAELLDNEAEVWIIEAARALDQLAAELVQSS